MLTMIAVSIAAYLLLQAFTAVLATSAIAVSRDTWDDLNSTVGGKLHEATPLALPCFSSYNGETAYRDSSACSVIEQNYTNPQFRVSHFSAYMNMQWETCQETSEQCLLDDTNSTNPLAWTEYGCNQGSISQYYIDVEGAADVQAAFNFSESTGVNIVVKNTGHDYKGRSSSQGALALWTHNLNSTSYNPSFVPEGCSDSSYNAITMGAGVQWGEAYEFADENNVTIIGGYEQTIGASGGWLLGGGYSILSPVYGLGADRVVEIKIVTPDGEYRVVNECQNQDLFWALRGGGGATFGVVLESTQRVEPNPVTLQVAVMSLNASASDPGSWAEILVDNTYQWALQGWGGHLLPSNLVMITPLLTLEEAQESMANATAYVNSTGGTVSFETLPSWYAFFVKYSIPSTIGVIGETVPTSRLIPSSLFQCEEGKANLTAALTNISANMFIAVGNPLLYNATRGSTSVNPVWYDSIWHLNYVADLLFNSTLQEKKNTYTAAEDAIQPFRDMSPGAGSYFNEGSIYEPDYEQSYWGSNYDRLLALKEKYDPLGLLDCWQCVGWSGATDPSYYSCYVVI